MSKPLLNEDTFNADNSCSACPAGQTAYSSDFNDDTSCVTCDANKFDTNGDATDGCEAGCAVVIDGTCDACSSTIASGCTAVTCNTGFVSFCYCCYCFTLQDLFLL